MKFRGDADGVHLVGDWDRQTAFDPRTLGDAAGHGLVRTTVKVQLVEGWALYRVDGFTTSGVLTARRIRRGRAKASS